MGCLILLLLLFGFFFLGCPGCDDKDKEQTYRYTIEVDNGLFSDTYYSNYYEEKDGILYFDVAGTKYTSNGNGYTIKHNY